MSARLSSVPPTLARLTTVLAFGLVAACGGAPAQQDPASFAGPPSSPATYVLTVAPQFEPYGGSREPVQGGQCYTAIAPQPGDIELGRCVQTLSPTQVRLENQVRDGAVVATLTKDGVQLSQQTLFYEMQASFDLAG